MWHLREISDDIVTVDILSHCECDLRLMMTECIIFEDFPYTYDIAFLIWDFDTHESESWDRCLDTDRLRLECESEVFFQAFYLRKAYSLTWSQTILDDGRSYTLPFHIDIYAELEECLLDQERLLFDLIGRYDDAVLDLIEELGTWKVPRSKIYRL